MVFKEQGGANVPGSTADRTFSAEGLTPYTNYTFQVAGVNNVDTGPFTNITTIITAGDGLSILINDTRFFNLFILPHSSWSCV